MKNKINYVDICCGLNWGDEAKVKNCIIFIKNRRL